MATIVSYDTGDDAAVAQDASATHVLQTFTMPYNATLSSIEVLIYRTGAPGTVSLGIYATDDDGEPTGDAIHSVGFNGNTLTDNAAGEWKSVAFTDVLTVGTLYALRISGGDDAGNKVSWRCDSTSATYVNGERLHSTDGGTSYTHYNTQDLMFRVKGTKAFTPPSDVVTYKQLVAVGNNTVEYEDSAGSMVELAAASGDIDTTDQLDIFEAFGKAFIVNGANLKVVDFTNVKLTHAALGTAHAKGDILTQNQTGGAYAYMIVDFTNTAKTATYGTVYYAGGSTAFNTTNAVSGSGSGSGFTPTAVTDPDPPHWYDWTVYPGGSSGEMPAKAYIGCLHNGRCVLSGNPREPHQWYMSRQYNPWDWAYVANDAATPVRGGNCDAGELGDIVRALVPYKDNLLVTGCATRIDFIMGDPAAGGTIRELDLTTGIFGFKSWCWDGENNFYFWGTNGLYKTSVPGVPVCISEQPLPNLVADESANPSTHRITLGYDRKNRGIKIAITKLSDGSHSNYWYDLRSQGFFPECSASNSHGIYSMLYYPANSESYRDLLMGCKDGYIRVHDSTVKNDDGTTISSHVSLGPISLGGDPGLEGSIGSLDIVLGGGGSSGSEADSNDADYKVFVSDTAAGLIENITANGTAAFAGTVTGPGRRRGSKRTQSARGVFGGVRISNNTAGENFILDHVNIKQKPKGKKK